VINVLGLWVRYLGEVGPLVDSSAFSDMVRYGGEISNLVIQGSNFVGDDF
jgi:hypothetical protein